jgi:hypothetical protein
VESRIPPARPICFSRMMINDSGLESNTAEWLNAKSIVWVSFGVHAALFTVVVGSIFALREDWALFWPIVGWTVGVILHGVSVFIALQLMRRHLIPAEIEADHSR